MSQFCLYVNYRSPVTALKFPQDNLITNSITFRYVHNSALLYLLTFSIIKNPVKYHYPFF